MTENKVLVFPLQRRFEKFGRAVKRTALLSLGELKCRRSALEIYLVSDREMQSVNRKWRGKNKPTNVLSFENASRVPRPDLGGRVFLGEIFLAPDYIQVKKDEMGFLIVHGVLHLLGYTHGRAKDSIIMNNKEAKTWRKICQKY